MSSSTATLNCRLLRASDFCQPSPSNTEGTPVQLRLVWREEVEPVVYVTSTRLLRRAGLVLGRWALLRSQDSKTTLVVRVERLEQPQQPGGQDKSDDEEQDILYLPPLTALNLGLVGDHMTLRCFLDSLLGAAENDNQPLSWAGSVQPYHSPPDAAVAQRVTLKPWGRRSLSCNHHNNANTGSLSSRQQTRPLAMTAWEGPFPRAGSWLQPGKLIGVVDSSKESELPFYYQVLEVLTTTKEDEDRIREPTRLFSSQQQLLTYRTTSATRYRLETGLPGPTCPRLPPQLSLTKQQPDLHHPAMPQLLSALWAASDLSEDDYGNENTSQSDASVVARRVLHIVGTDQDHDVLEAVKTTAALLGRTLVTVQGLACFAHLNAVGRNTSTTGSWVDKLSGLEAALQLSRQQAPAVLYIDQLDAELASLQHDGPLAEDQQERLWAVLTEQLLSAGSSLAMRSFASPTTIVQTPSVLVVVSTSKPVLTGPFFQCLGGSSETVPLPTTSRAYVSHSLWPRSGEDGPNEEVVEDDESLMEHIWDSLCREDRTAHEIRQLRIAFLEARLQDEKSTEDPKILFDQLCEQHDKERRKGSGQLAQHIVPVHWEDVGGLAQVRREILEAIELPLKHPDLFSSCSSSGRSGILLYGPPGSGKTLVAKAVATECGLPFVSIKGPELLGSYVGESEAHVRTIFEQARELAKRNRPAACILFFDELDSLAPRRGDHGSGGGNVMDRVVATLFAELDRHSEDGQVFVMGATNRPDLLDPSLLRPGRLDRLVYLGICPEDRSKILASQMRKLRLEGTAEDMAAAVVKTLPSNLTGADLSVVASGAVLRATERLCREADSELEELIRQGNERITLDEVLASWEGYRLEPIVCLQDLLDAAADVVPSVSPSVLKTYESLRENFRK